MWGKPREIGQRGEADIGSEAMKSLAGAPVMETQEPVKSTSDAQPSSEGLAGPATELAQETLWARVSQEVDARLTDKPRYPIRLHPTEWQSGDHFWIVDTVGEKAAVNQAIAKLAKAVFAGNPFKALSVSDGGILMVLSKDNSAKV